VKFNIFLIYLRACKLSMVALIILLFCLTTSASLSANIWLSKWTDTTKSDISKNNTASSSKNQIHNMNIYSILAMIQGLLAFVMQLLVKLATYVAGRQLHWVILLGVLHAPMSFFDTTPIGCIINRFSKDIDAVDSTISEGISQSLVVMITVVETLVILIYGSWFVILVLIPLTALFIFIQVKSFLLLCLRNSLNMYL